jgi:hypothetical protein
MAAIYNATRLYRGLRTAGVYARGDGWRALAIKVLLANLAMAAALVAGGRPAGFMARGRPGTRAPAAGGLHRAGHGVYLAACWRWACGRATCAARRPAGGRPIPYNLDLLAATSGARRAAGPGIRHLELIRGKHNLRPGHRGCAVTIGNFDGLHLGHRAVLERLIGRARELGLPAVVMSFEPTPREYFMGAAAPPRLARFREKFVGPRGAGRRPAVLRALRRAMAALSPEDFIREYLVDGLGTRYLAIGDDFRFGRNRAGDFGTLRRPAPSGASRSRTRRPASSTVSG